MIHFDFVVDDVDAENIMDCINSEINRCFVKRLDLKTSVDFAKWLDAHIEYLEELKGKMKNKRVETDSNKTTLYENYYWCTACGHEWNEVWNSMCEHECPMCRTTMTPSESHEFKRE